MKTKLTDEVSPVMTDAEVAAFFRIGTRLLQRRLACPKDGEVDFRRASPMKIGGRRFWLRAAVYRLAGFGAAESRRAKGGAR